MRFEPSRIDEGRLSSLVEFPELKASFFRAGEADLTDPEWPSGAVFVLDIVSDGVFGFELSPPFESSFSRSETATSVPGAFFDRDGASLSDEDIVLDDVYGIPGRVRGGGASGHFLLLVGGLTRCCKREKNVGIMGLHMQCPPKEKHLY